MGKAQSKRSVDITTETKKGTEDEITEKLEKIEDLDKKEIVNGDATISEKSDPEKKDAEDGENDKDMTTEKDVELQASGDATADTQSAAETPKEEGGSAAPEEISPLADESIKKSKKEKVKKKWSFRSISFGKKDKQKPAKSEEAAEDGSAATNGANADEKTINEPDDTQKDKLANDHEEKTREAHENGNASPRELNGDEQSEEKPSDEKTNDITANTTKTTTTTETCVPVQNETAAVSSDISEKTESTAVINETKISENATVDDASQNGNGLDEKMNATDQEPQKADGINASVETSLGKTTTLASDVTNESSVTTNGQVVDQIHQNGDHGEDEQKVVEISKAQIEVNSPTDNKVSGATLDSISSTSINPSNVQDLNTSSEKPDEIVQINIEESVAQKSTVTEINSPTIDQSSLNETPSMVKEVENKVDIKAAHNSTSDANDKSSEEKLGVDPSPPPLPISPPPSQVSVFAFTNNDEPSEDSIQNQNYESTIKEEKQDLPPSISELPLIENINRQEIQTISSENPYKKETCYEQAQCREDEVHKDIDIHCEEENKDAVNEESICKTLNNYNEVPSSDHFEESQIVENSAAAAVIDEITETAAEIVSKQLNCNEEEQSVENEIVVLECKDNKPENHEGHVDGEKQLVCESDNSSNKTPIAIEQTNNITIECSLNFSASNSIQQDRDEMNSIEKSENLDEKHSDPSKEFATTKDIIDNITVAEITQDLSVTCE